MLSYSHIILNFIESNNQAWFHVCIEIDVAESIIRYSKHGGEIQTYQNISLTDLKKFEITIGETNPNKTKFDGLFSNLNIFDYDSSLNIKSMSSNPCNYEGNYLSWKDMKFDLIGDVTYMKIPKSSVCFSGEKFLLPLPSEMDFLTAYESCRLFPDGIITEFKSQQDVKSLNFLGNFRRCEYYWTPYTGIRKNIENIFIDHGL